MLPMSITIRRLKRIDSTSMVDQNNILNYLGGRLRTAVLVGSLVSITAAFGFSQKAKVEPATSGAVVQPAAVRSSAAHAELLLRRTELESDLESLLVEYTEEYPKVKEIRFVLGLFDRDTARIEKVKSAEAGKLTVALGKLMVRKAELETDLWKLQQTYKDEHPEVKRAKRRVQIFENAVGQILN